VTSGGVNSDKEGIFLTASCCSFPGSELSKYGNYLPNPLHDRSGMRVAHCTNDGSGRRRKKRKERSNQISQGGLFMKVPTVLLTIVFAGVTLTVPVSGTVAAERAKSTEAANRYSDRDRVKASKDSEDKLEQALKTGEEKAFYRRELEKMGWKITSVNYDKPDYVEYEIVKGDDSYEVQIDFDKNSRKANKVDVALNAWKTDATENALKNGKNVAAYPAGTTKNPERYSDRDRVKSSKDSEDKLEQALKTGEEKAFYRRELEKMGWKITSVNYDKPDYVEYEIVKGDDSYEVQIDFDKNSRKANKVDVALNAWKADATKQALQGQTQARR
jgi:uncharacterized protein YmfQ (DUF2313 family)